MSRFETNDQTMLDAYHLNVFTDKPFSGNPATVVAQSEGLDSEQMQRIAQECNTPETIFVHRDNDNISLRFFTPQEEVPSCGHGTIAAAYVIDKLNTGKNWTFKTAAGDVNCHVDCSTHNSRKYSNPLLNEDIDPNNNSCGNANPYTNYRISTAPLMAERSTHITAARIIESFSQLQSENIEGVFIVRNKAGKKRLLVQVSSMGVLYELQPDYSTLKQFQIAEQISGSFFFTSAGINSTGVNGNILTGRMFAPVIGINEDPVNGNSSAALAAVVELMCQESKQQLPEQIKVLQGEVLERPGMVGVNMLISEERGFEIELFGQVTPVFTFQLPVPPIR